MSVNMSVSMKDLERVAVNLDEVSVGYNVLALADKFKAELDASCDGPGAIGDIGIGTSYASVRQAHPMFDSSPLAMWLLTTNAAQMMRNQFGNGLGTLVKTGNNLSGWNMPLPGLAWTEPPPDTTGACCWVPMELSLCGDTTPLALLCIHRCEDIMDSFIELDRRAGVNDLRGPWQRVGESKRDAMSRWLRINMAFYTAQTLINGHSELETNILKPFHGLIEVMERPSVIAIDGSSVLGAFEQIQCRIDVLGTAGQGSVAWMNPLVLAGVVSQIQPDINGNLPKGWSKNGLGQVSYNAIPLRTDPFMPVDTTGVIANGDIWILNSNSTFGFLREPITPSVRENNPFHIVEEVGSSNRADNCGHRCEYYYNYGGVDNLNDQLISIIHGVPTSGECSGMALAGLENIINPETLIPRA
ncbi:MAG: hypothetical protein FWE25_03310 [Lachnospiraceae bacterium]|nr:hypothetical protein [Lachnospiraceae bacterium]